MRLSVLLKSVPPPPPLFSKWRGVWLRLPACLSRGLPERRLSVCDAADVDDDEDAFFTVLYNGTYNKQWSHEYFTTKTLNEF